MYRVVEKLKGVKRAIRQLKKQGFGDVEMEKIKAKDKLDDEMMHKEKIARERHMTSRRNVYSMLQQKAKINWLKCGDENTNVFYQAIKARRVSNRVHAVHTTSGEWVNTPEKVKEAFLKFYQNFFAEK